MGHLYYHRDRFERPHQPADHHHRRERTVPLHSSFISTGLVTAKNRYHGYSLKILGPWLLVGQLCSLELQLCEAQSLLTRRPPRSTLFPYTTHRRLVRGL